MILFDFDLIKEPRYEYAGKLINEIGNELGGWIKQQRQKGKPKLNAMATFGMISKISPT